jgi:dTDP-4-amino-4,6-dideoxygalactose transaminase
MLYLEELANSRIKFMQLRKNTEWNHSYFPIVFESEIELLNSLNALKQKGILPRRYFYPSLNTISYTKGPSCPNSEEISSRILCLPLYAGLEEHSVKQTISILNDIIR